MVHGKNRIPYWIDRRLTGLAGPDYDATISFGLPFEPEDSQYGKSRLIHRVLQSSWSGDYATRHHPEDHSKPRSYRRRLGGVTGHAGPVLHFSARLWLGEPKRALSASREQESREVLRLETYIYGNDREGGEMMRTLLLLVILLIGCSVSSPVPSPATTPAPPVPDFEFTGIGDGKADLYMMESGTFLCEAEARSVEYIYDFAVWIKDEQRGWIYCADDAFLNTRKEYSSQVEFSVSSDLDLIERNMREIRTLSGQTRTRSIVLEPGYQQVVVVIGEGSWTVRLWKKR